MDWNKVIENLRAQTTYYMEQVNKYEAMPGHYERAKEMRASANMASILASALTSGMKAGQ